MSVHDRYESIARAQEAAINRLLFRLPADDRAHLRTRRGAITAGQARTSARRLKERLARNYEDHWQLPR